MGLEHIAIESQFRVNLKILMKVRITALNCCQVKVKSIHYKVYLSKVKISQINA